MTKVRRDDEKVLGVVQIGREQFTVGLFLGVIDGSHQDGYNLDIFQFTRRGDRNEPMFNGPCDATCD